MPDIQAAVINQLNLVVKDKLASIAFYKLLGVQLELSTRADWNKHHASTVLANGFRFELDSESFAEQWNPDWKEGRGRSGGIMFFGLEKRDDVDRLYNRIVEAGLHSEQIPTDAFWGERYAIVSDPDGNSVGLMSGIEPERRGKPPAPPSPQVE